MLIKQYGERRLRELGAHKRRKLHLQREHQQPRLADAARLITDVIHPTCDVIPAGSPHHADGTTPGDEGSDHGDHVTSRPRAAGSFRRLTNTGNGHILSYLPLNDMRGNYTLW